jgi:hypothetical protein
MTCRSSDEPQHVADVPVVEACSLNRPPAVRERPRELTQAQAAERGLPSRGRWSDIEIGRKPASTAT